MPMQRQTFFVEASGVVLASVAIAAAVAVQTGDDFHWILWSILCALFWAEIRFFRLITSRKKRDQHRLR